MTTQAAFASALSQIRETDGVPMTAIADRIKVPKSTLDNMRRGSQKVKKDVVEKIIAAYPQFQKYLDAAEEEKEGLEDADISRKFDKLESELREIRLLLEQQLRKTAEREVELMKALLKDR